MTPRSENIEMAFTQFIDALAEEGIELKAVKVDSLDHFIAAFKYIGIATNKSIITLFDVEVTDE